MILDSGRNLAATGSLAQLIGTSGFLVAENGGVIAKYQTPIKILGRIEDARAALRMLRKRIGNKVRERPDHRLGMRLSSVSLERSLNPEKARKLLQKSKMGIDLIDTGVTYVLLDARCDKGTIDQSSCNLDYSCLAGDCPSFLTVVPAGPTVTADPPALDPQSVPDPPRPRVSSHTTRITRMGAGVVTIAQSSQWPRRWPVGTCGPSTRPGSRRRAGRSSRLADSQRDLVGHLAVPHHPVRRLDEAEFVDLGRRSRDW